MFSTRSGAKGDYLVYIVLASAICARLGLHPASTILPTAQGDISFYSSFPQRDGIVELSLFVGSRAKMGMGWVFDSRR